MPDAADQADDAPVVRPYPQRTLHLVRYAPPELELDQLEAAVRGDVRVILNGQELHLWLPPRCLAAYERATSDHYLVRQAGDEALREAWLFWCKAMREPCVVATLGPAYAHVRLDLFPTGRALTQRAIAAITAMLLRETGHIEFLDGTYVGLEICVSPWVPLARAERVAATLYRIARTCLDTSRQQGMACHRIVGLSDRLAQGGAVGRHDPRGSAHDGRGAEGGPGPAVVGLHRVVLARVARKHDLAFFSALLMSFTGVG